MRLTNCCLGNTPLHRVALIGNFEAVSLMCKKAPDIINRPNNIPIVKMRFTLQFTLTVSHRMECLRYTTLTTPIARMCLFGGGPI